MAYPCERCNMDDGSPVCLMDERCTSAGPGREPEALELSPFDAAEHLRDEEDARLYLQACIDEDPSDEAFIERAMATVERARARWTHNAELTGRPEAKP